MFFENYKKLSIRFKPLFLNLFRSVLTPVLSLTFSFIIVHYFSKSLWGDFVKIQLYFFLTHIISNWGTSTYLQKAFSKKPSEMILTWQKQFLARLPVAFICIICLCFFIELNHLKYIIFWYLFSFIYNSFLSILNYNRDYKFLIIIELISFLFLITLILSVKNLTLEILIFFYALYVFFKTIVVSSKYYYFLKIKKFEIKISTLKFGFPFLLISITGFLHSKIDVYTYSFFSTNTELGEYQIISSFFIFSQSIVSILLLPYVKNFYRINSKTLQKIRFQVAFIGVFTNVIIISLIALILENLFQIHISFLEYIIGFFIGYPSYYYSIRVFELFKFNKEKKVIKISFLGVIFNLFLSIVFLYFNLNVLGVLLANAITQIITLFIYLFPIPNDNISKED